LYFIGAVGGTPDYGAAIKWFTRAAEQGNAGAQNNLGICYESGKGVARSEESAMHFYGAAAKQGHPSALSSLGYLYLKQRKFDLALECLHKAAEQADKVRESNNHTTIASAHSRIPNLLIAKQKTKGRMFDLSLPFSMKREDRIWQDSSFSFFLSLFFPVQYSITLVLRRVAFA
jgi:tetratricopeptide (TPR) repeat protein